VDGVGFEVRTGLRLLVRGASGAGRSVVGGGNGGRRGGRLEQNAALSLARSLVPVNTRVGVQGSALSVAFIAPGVARHHEGVLARISGETGWDVVVAERVDQGQVMAFARLVFERQGVGVKRVGFDPVSAELQVHLREPVGADMAREVSGVVQDALGLRLRIEPPQG
jgi:hypothetical protein